MPGGYPYHILRHLLMEPLHIRERFERMLQEPGQESEALAFYELGVPYLTAGGSRQRALIYLEFAFRLITAGSAGQPKALLYAVARKLGMAYVASNPRAIERPLGVFTEALALGDQCRVERLRVPDGDPQASENPDREWMQACIGFWQTTEPRLANRSDSLGA